MNRFDIEEFAALVETTRGAVGADAKGRCLEELVAYLLDAVPGLQVYERRVRLAAEEVDVVAFNERSDRAFSDWGQVVFVECKNWSKPAGAPELALFIDKLRTKGLSYGLLVAATGVTGDKDGRRDATLKIREALADGFRVVVVTLDDLADLRSAADFSDLVIRKLCGLFVDRFG